MSAPLTPLQSLRSSTRVETDTYEISGEQIVAALRETGRLPMPNAEVSTVKTDAWVRVPGGGDWSNSNLDLNEYLVKVRVTTETRA